MFYRCEYAAALYSRCVCAFLKKSIIFYITLIINGLSFFIINLCAELHFIFLLTFYVKAKGVKSPRKSKKKEARFLMSPF